MNFFFPIDPPKIKLPARYHSKLVVQKGETVNVKIPFSGNPKPSGEWNKNDAKLDTSSSSYFVEFLNSYVTLTIKNADIADSGKYTLNMSNSLGSDSCTITIQVQGKIK